MGCDEMVLSHLGSGVGEEGVVSSSHCSTVERLYAWEKKLYQEVKVNFWFPYLLWAPGGAFAHTQSYCFFFFKFYFWGPIMTYELWNFKVIQ